MSVPKVHRVNPDQLKTGTMVERAEHPWASPAVARRIARDHIEDDPEAYSNNKHGGGSERNTTVILNQNVKAVPARKRKKVVPKERPFNIFTYGRELL